MAEQTRQHLKIEFAQGERPSGDDFADLIDSSLNKRNDGLAVENGDLLLSGGLALGGSQREKPGTLRLNQGNAQVHDGNQWVNLGGGEGVFEEVGTSGEVAYTGGNVGIGDRFNDANPPTHRLEVDLSTNSGPRERVRFGSVVLCKGSAKPRRGNRLDAYLYNREFEEDESESNYALRARANGEVWLNAKSGQKIRITQDNNDEEPFLGLSVSKIGNVIIRGSGDLLNSGEVSLQVNGNAFKNKGGDLWERPSDARLKEDVRDLEAGLEQLLKMRPVRFRYNGKAGTSAGTEGVGFLGQEIEKICPEMITRVPAKLDDGQEIDDLMTYNGTMLTYVLVNAVKELAGKVERLEKTFLRTKTRGDDK